MTRHRRSSFRPARGRLATAAMVAVALGATAGAARADDDPNPYSLGVLETISHDSNIFRAPAGPQVASDWISTTGLVGSVNQVIGRERLIANGEFDLNRFKRNPSLNSTSHAVNIEGDWATVGDLSGELGYSNSSQLYRYSPDNGQAFTAKNTLDQSSEFARFHYGVVTRWTINAIFNGLRRTYSAPVYAYQDVNRWDGSFGFGYQATPDLQTTLAFRRTHGVYEHFRIGIEDDFTRNDIVFGMTYVVSGFSSFNLHANTGREKHTAIAGRSANTWAADAQWIYKPAGRTTLTMDFIRDDDTGTFDTAFFTGNLATSSAFRRTALSAKVDYEVTSKILLNLTGQYGRRQVSELYTGLSGLNQAGSDRTYDAGVGFQYSATRWAQLGCNAKYEKRTTRGSVASLTYPYKDTTYACTAQFSFN